MTTTRELAIAGAALAVAGSSAMGAPVYYRTATVEGVNMAYRESGSPDKPALLLLHGVPSSSRMFDALMRRLGDSYHMVAPDYPGFGNSDVPDPVAFDYTFNHLSEVVEKFADVVGLDRYVLFMQDYGAPVGMGVAQTGPTPYKA
ncbi:alpha/beta fold hydrolase [Candidatus Phyllobacterium onerii]|uniref:alpha/beta fold hydrolase n=1 Tax=Candidatus Phyllobacterium onerii TaxID=3020828 RepID=UPI00232B86E6|nr:alpha/beta fold hydrolase [Phyllobacterium sp. IY22]